MKISVITLHNTNNYGSVLQTYATQYVLKRMKNEVEFVDYYRDGVTVKEQVKNNLKYSTVYNKNFLFKIIGKTLLTISFKKQEKVFKSFLKENINLSEVYTTFDELKKNPPIADVYCSGSDQVWNSDWNRKIDKTFFLDYAPNNSKKISYASSIGKSEISNKEAKEIIPLLKEYKYITVREQSAVDILKKHNINAKLILDPTLILSNKEWKSFAYENKKRNNQKKYILVYQLNTNFKEFDKYVKKVSKELNLPVIRISVFAHQTFKYGKLLLCPEVKEFLRYIDGAEYIITDSFHCTAFSINLNKKFISIYPPKFPTRIENILSKTNLLDRKYNKDNDILKITEEIDYSKVNKILDKERKNSLKIIEEMLGNVND